MNLRKPLSAAVAAALGGLLSTMMLMTAQGATPPDATSAAPANPPKFEDIDKNKDGAVSKDEAQGSWLAATFMTVDTNGDGYVSRTEYQKALS